jgi:hypothetical protein
VGQSNLTPVCRECGAKGPKGSRKAHEAGWARGEGHTWLCPTHAEEARQRFYEAERKRRAERDAQREKDRKEGKVLPLGLLFALAGMGAPRR